MIELLPAHRSRDTGTVRTSLNALLHTVFIEPENWPSNSPDLTEVVSLDDPRRWSSAVRSAILLGPGSRIRYASLRPL